MITVIMSWMLTSDIQPMKLYLILQVFSDLDLERQEEKCNFYSGMFAVLGVVAFFAMLVMVSLRQDARDAFATSFTV